MLGRWLTNRIEHTVGQMAATMPQRRREWGDAVVAEFAAIPPGERDLLWALGGLWFVLRCRATPLAVASWIFAALGIFSVAPWALVSFLQLRGHDAPDATARSLAGMLVAQVLVIIAFVVAPWRRARPLLVVALVGYAVAAAVAAADNGGYPLLAAAVFAVPPGLAAVPVLLATVVDRRRQPVD